MIDINAIREQFPILNEKVNGKPLVYFDNAATTQKPLSVINAITKYYSTMNANIHRGIHSLAESATLAFEDTRKAAQKFVNAASSEEIIFTKGVTEAINLVAFSMEEMLKPGDEVIISELEHHSNIVPWQMVCGRSGATLKVIPVDDEGDLILEEYEKMLSQNTRIVSVNFASNTLGTINPVKEIIKKAHEYEALVLLDGAQAASHLEVDVQDLDVDFFTTSAHKMYGPTGVGILYGKQELLELLPPYQGGGEMIETVTFETLGQATY